MKRTIIFDFMRTLYDPTRSALYEGVRTMLPDLADDRKLILYSRQDKSRLGLLQELGIEECFIGAHFAEKKTAENMRAVIESHGMRPEECIVVGDMPDSELCAGSEIGCETVWMKHSIFEGSTQGLHCVPKHTVGSISELHSLLKQLS